MLVTAAQNMARAALAELMTGLPDPVQALIKREIVDVEVCTLLQCSRCNCMRTFPSILALTQRYTSCQHAKK